MQEALTWRELLGRIIEDPKERARLIEELGITNITLNRWVSGESVPRPQNLRHLLKVLPQHREEFQDLIKEEKGLANLSHIQQEETPKQIPAEFYSRVLVARASTSEHLRFWATCHLILQQAIGQLDPDRCGMSIWVVRCMPPSGPYNKVRSLRENVGLGTPPWGGNLEQTAMFLGAESLTGHVVTLCRPGIVQDFENDPGLQPILWGDNEKSAAIYPILYAGRIAGVLLVSSTHTNYFTQAITDLVQRYADLIALAFEVEDFYAPDDIALCVMPPPDEQKKHFANFRQMVADAMLSASYNNQSINNVQADMLVWKNLEETLLQIPMLKSRQSEMR